MKIILYQPDIPQNTGNIARTCAVTGTELILVEPLGFNLSTKQMRRAGLDYWDQLQFSTIDNLDTYLEKTNAPFYFFSSHSKVPYTSVNYPLDAILIFGSETKGLPKHLHEKYSEQFVTIPMLPNSRCLNLSNSAAIALYEGLRQNNFPFAS